MATAVEVFGPYTISALLATSGSAKVLLGRGDNDDLFKLDISYTYTDVFTNESGTMPYESIRTGGKVECSFSLIVIDRTIVSGLLAGMDGGSTGTTAPIPKVGSILGNAVSTGATTATTATITVNYTDGATATFLKVPRCRLLSFKQSDFGNKATRMTFAFEALPAVTHATGVIDAAGEFYTIGTVA